MTPRAELLVFLAVHKPPFAFAQPGMCLMQIRRQLTAVKAEPVELSVIVPQLGQCRMKRLIRAPCLALNVPAHLLRRLPEVRAERGKLRKLTQDRRGSHSEINAVLVCPCRARAPQLAVKERRLQRRIRGKQRAQVCAVEPSKQLFRTVRAQVDEALKERTAATLALPQPVDKAALYKVLNRRRIAAVKREVSRKIFERIVRSLEAAVFKAGATQLSRIYRENTRISAAVASILPPWHCDPLHRLDIIQKVEFPLFRTALVKDDSRHLAPGVFALEKVRVHPNL